MFGYLWDSLYDKPLLFGDRYEQDLFRIVDQLNHGLHLVEDEQEQLQIARLNLQAARAARQASAFETGLNYAQAGIELLGENCWDQDYQLTLEPNTVFARHPPPLPDEDTVWAMQDAAEVRLREAGYGNYEISAWARPGAACARLLVSTPLTRLAQGSAGSINRL